MAFNRDRSNRSGRGGGGFRPRFGDRGPVEMHQAVCDNCGRECEVPFRPTGGKPIFCSDCFEKNKGSDSRGGGGRNFERSSSYEEKRMYEAVCDECGNTAKLPFEPRGDKPVYCSNCFEKKNEGGGRDTRNAGSNQGSNNNQKFDELNAKLDAILKILTPLVAAEEVAEQMIEETSEQPQEQVEEIIEKNQKKLPRKKPLKNKF